MLKFLFRLFRGLWGTLKHEIFMKEIKFSKPLVEMVILPEPTLKETKTK